MLHRTTLMLGLLGLLVGTTTPGASQEEVASLAARVGPAVVTLRAYDASGRELQTGSGFAIEDGRIVTNAHVVRGASTVEILDSRGTLVGTTRTAEALSDAVDLAILPRPATRITGLPLAAQEPEVGTRVIAVGAPRGLTNTVSDGIVSAIREVDSRRLIQLTAPMSEGSSGGPVLDMNGSVIGIGVSTLVAGQNLNFAVPVANLAVLLDSPPTPVAFTASRGDDEASGRSTTVGARARLTPGVSVTGRLDFSDRQLRDHSFFRDWYFEGRAGKTVTVTMTSSDFDTYLMLGRIVNGRFVRLASNDDGGSGTNSRLRYRLRATGEYVVRANSFFGGEVGSFVLRLEQH